MMANDNWMKVTDATTNNDLNSLAVRFFSLPNRAQNSGVSCRGAMRVCVCACVSARPWSPGLAHPDQGELYL